MQGRDVGESARSAALAYEQTLQHHQRKRLGQYFTGVLLGKLLAHLALDSGVETVLDPMAGTGDLLDATFESATERGFSVRRLDGIEIDNPTADACQRRIRDLLSLTTEVSSQIVAGDAFDPRSLRALASDGYGLVITNPPYVRYQTNRASGTPEAIRSGLIALISRHLTGAGAQVWAALAQGYSGLADLSVPAWLLAAALVRPKGYLALVVPATWRSRDYADVIRYLLLRSFHLKCIVEDKQPGWFRNALVRTNLIVARRLPDDQIATPLKTRPTLPKAVWLQIAREAASPESLIGTAFDGSLPEARFATWVNDGCRGPRFGITVRDFDLRDEWKTLEPRLERREWYLKLEGTVDDLPLFVQGPAKGIALPGFLKAVFPESFSPQALTTLEEEGIQVGQGLRTGCNTFFYVTALCDSQTTTDVQSSSFFGHSQIRVPPEVLRPVLRRQSEIPAVTEGHIPRGRVLDLRNWVLPEDFDVIREAEPTYRARGLELPQVMPDELADYVRRAASAHAPGQPEKRIPDLSAVRTNVRPFRNGDTLPRFWYMLPDFTHRHVPDAFVPRVNDGLPWVESNLDPPVLIDANFSTFWTFRETWTPYALKALLNSAWCRVFMEVSGTPLGGGALKLEATHLRRMPIPVLSADAKERLSVMGAQLKQTTPEIQAYVDEIVFNALRVSSPLRSSDRLGRQLIERAQGMASLRRRPPS